MAKSDTVKASNVSELRRPWPVDDRIRWIEWRVRELTIEWERYIDERGKYLLEEKAAGGRKLQLGDAVADYAVWLLKVRDGLSWHQIAYRFFPKATEPLIERYELRVRRVFARVEKDHPRSAACRPRQLSRQDKQLLHAIMLGVVPISTH